jgi:hypothetical protein
VYTFKVESCLVSGDLIRFGSPERSTMYFNYEKLISTKITTKQKKGGGEKDSK